MLTGVEEVPETPRQQRDLFFFVLSSFVQERPAFETDRICQCIYNIVLSALLAIRIQFIQGSFLRMFRQYRQLRNS